MIYCSGNQCRVSKACQIYIGGLAGKLGGIEEPVAIEVKEYCQDDGSCSKYAEPPSLPGGIDFKGLAVQILDGIERSGMRMEEVEKNLEYTILEVALKESGGSKAAAARILRMNRTTVVERTKKHGLG